MEQGRGMLTYGAIMLCLGVIAVILVGGSATDCSSATGLLAQGASQNAATACTDAQRIFYGGIGVGAIGALLVLCGVIAGARSQDPPAPPGYPRTPGWPGTWTPPPTSAAPGWYLDPSRPGFVRWWNGTTWTGPARPVGPPGGHQPGAAPPGSAPPQPKR